jgi:3-hydroxyisobutyrate dehydrogenase-like beta-hydroxyacid dehydrogenase
MTRGVAGAKQGTLAFFVGGDAAHIQKAQPVLEAMGNTFIRFPTASDAHTAKLISNVLSYSTVALVNEALMMGAKSGVDLSILHKALMEGAPSKALEAFGPRIISGEYEPPRVTIDHACEDMLMQQALAARCNVPTFMHSLAQELYRALSSRGLGERDVSMIAELWRHRDDGGAQR